MNNLKIKNVEFLGDTLVAAQDKDNNIWAGISYFCKALGLNKNEKDRQIKNIQTDETLKRGCVKFDAGVFDANNEAIALKLDFIPLWLAKITITPTMKANNPALVEKLIDYQLKAKDALAAAFLPSCNTIYQYPLSAATFESVANLSRVLERIMKSEGSQPHEVALVVKSLCQQSGIELLDCFVKVPAYEQLSMNEIVMRV